MVPRWYSGRVSEANQLTIRCPDCDSELIIDSKTGTVLLHRSTRKTPGDSKNFDQLLADLDQQKDRAEQLFDQEKAALADRERLLRERFDEAMKRAAEEPDDEPPLRPFDLD